MQISILRTILEKIIRRKRKSIADEVSEEMKKAEEKEKEEKNKK